MADATWTIVHRVSRVVRDLSAGREVSDADLLQHRNDCRLLMDEASERWQVGRESRETVDRWQACFIEACNRLSQSWKAAREAQIQSAIAEGTGCYFLDQADAARRGLEGGRP